MSGNNSSQHQTATGGTESGSTPDTTAGSAEAEAARETEATTGAAAPFTGGETTTGPGGVETAATVEAALMARPRLTARPRPAAATAPAGAGAGAAAAAAADAGSSPEAEPDGHAGTGDDAAAAQAVGRPPRGLLAAAAIAGALLIGLPFLVSGMIGRPGSDGKSSDQATNAGTVLNGATTESGPSAYDSAPPDPESSSPTASPSPSTDSGRKKAAKSGAGAAAAGVTVVMGSSTQAPKKAPSGGSSEEKPADTKPTDTKATDTKATVTATVSSAPGTTIFSHASNRCIEMVGHKGADGSPLEIWDCNGKNWQKWEFRSDGTVRSMGLCMDVAWGSSKNGAVIQLAVCSGNPAQQFRLNSSSDLVNPQADKCVDVKDQQTGNGTRLQLWDCNGQDNQKWSTR